MDLDEAFGKLSEFNIKDHCHVNTNEDGDRFVGIKADTDDAMVYFPIGYQLPDEDKAIRNDIRHLIQVLSEFTTRDDRLLAVNKFAAPQSVDFPINAYTSVIEYYFDIGGKYYVETEQTYKVAPTGKQDWARTARKQMPLVQCKNGVSSFIYTNFEVRSITPNDAKLITQINKYCVYACRVQGAAASVGHVRGDGHHLQMVEERGHLFASARHAEGDDAASAVRHVLFGQRMVFVSLKARKAHPADARVGAQPLCYLERVRTVALHTYSQGLQMHAHDPRVDRCRC